MFAGEAWAEVAWADLLVPAATPPPPVVVVTPAVPSKALTTTDGAKGGYIVPPEFVTGDTEGGPIHSTMRDYKFYPDQLYPTPKSDGLPPIRLDRRPLRRRQRTLAVILAYLLWED